MPVPPPMTVHVFIGDPEQTGLWCPNCLKPSGLRMPLFMVSLTGVTHIGPVTRCYDCFRPIPKEDHP